MNVIGLHLSGNTNTVDMFDLYVLNPSTISILMASVEFSVDTSTTKVYYVLGNKKL